MFTTQVAAWEIAARTAVVYVAMLGGLRLAGKREIGQMTVFDLVVILLVWHEYRLVRRHLPLE